LKEGSRVTTTMEKLTLVETISIVDGTIENPITPYEVPLTKGIDSALGTMSHMIHKLGVAFNIGKTKGASVTYTVWVDDIETAIVFGQSVGLVIKEKASEAYLKEAGLKKLTLKDFTIDFTAFSIAKPAIVNVIKYHLGAYLEASVRAASYKQTAKTFFKKEIEVGKADMASWSVQTRSAVELTLYSIRDITLAAQEENTTPYLDSNRESARLGIAFKKEQRALKASK